MTLEDIEESLPNGLHDAEVTSVLIDYAQHRVTFDVCIWVGKMDDPPERREAYRTARVLLSGLIFLVIEPPDPKYPFEGAAHLTVDGCDIGKNLNSELLASLPSDVFVRSLWVNEWNAFMHVAAGHAELSWQEAEIRYRSDRKHFRTGETIDLK